MVRTAGVPAGFLQAQMVVRAATVRGALSYIEGVFSSEVRA
jgi:hypothetical protein